MFVCFALSLFLDDIYSVFSALGICWGTVFSSAAFVLPRMIQVRKARRDSLRRTTTRGPMVHISGIDVSGREANDTGMAGDASKTTPAPTTSNRTTISLSTSKSPGSCVDVTVPIAMSSGGNNDQVRVVRWEANADDIKDEKEAVISATNMDSC